MSSHTVTGFLEARHPMHVVCASCIREHHNQSHPLLSTKGQPQVHLRCDECMSYVDTDLDFAFRKDKRHENPAPQSGTPVSMRARRR